MEDAEVERLDFLGAVTLDAEGAGGGGGAGADFGSYLDWKVGSSRGVEAARSRVLAAATPFSALARLLLARVSPIKLFCLCFLDASASCGRRLAEPLGAVEDMVDLLGRNS